VIRALLLLSLVGCGSSSTPAARTTTTTPTGPSAAEQAAREQQHHDEIAAHHRKLEETQQDALGATCEAPKPTSAHERCLPSCYTTEPADPRAGKKLTGPTEIEHLVCQRDDDTLVFADELDEKLAARPHRGRPPKPHKKGTWQAAIEAKLGTNAIVTGNAMRQRIHPATQDKLRCVAVSVFTKAHVLDACGTTGEAACEAAGNAAARAINVVRYRLAEARRLHDSGKSEDCQKAALEAIAVSRGAPRWRQYAKLNVDQWDKRGLYRTRFDGILDEDTLFSTVATLGAEAQRIYESCGGPAGAPTAALQEQSFHTCW